MTCAIQDAASPHENPGSPLEVLRVLLKLGLTSFGGPAAHLGYFRNAGEIEALAGCDRLTISPQLLEALSKEEGGLARPSTPSTRDLRPPRPAGREAPPQDAQRGPDGDGETLRRHPASSITTSGR